LIFVDKLVHLVYVRHLEARVIVSEGAYKSHTHTCIAAQDNINQLALRFPHPPPLCEQSSLPPPTYCRAAPCPPCPPPPAASRRHCRRVLGVRGVQHSVPQQLEHRRGGGGGGGGGAAVEVAAEHHSAPTAARLCSA
jgi:hypothetical protein